MNTWNTLAREDTDLMDRAITLLETLSKDRNQTVLDYLQSAKKVSLSEICAATGLPEKQVAAQIKQIRQTGALDIFPAPDGEEFALNRGRLRQISTIACKIQG